MSTIDISKYKGNALAQEEVVKEKEPGSKRYQTLKEYTTEKLIKEQPDLLLGSIFDPVVQAKAKDYIGLYVKEWIAENGKLSNFDTVEDTIASIFNDILNLGVLQPFVEMKGVTDVYADGPGKIYYDKDGERVHTNAKFKNEKEMLVVMKKLASAAKKNLNKENPVINAQIGKNRFNVTLGQSEGGIGSQHYISIRVHRLEQFSVQELINAGQITQEAADFLHDIAQCKEIGGMFFGPTGSGKTTSLDTFIFANLPDKERVFLIEDEAEMRAAQKYPQKNIVELVVKKGVNEESSYSISRLIEDVSLRARPDRVFVSEIRRGEDADRFLYANSCGHPGYSTGHSYSALGSIKRLGKMVLQTRPKAELKEVEDDIFALLDIIVFIKPIKINGKKIRKVVDIVELYQDDKGNNYFNPIFKYKRTTGLKRIGVISESLATKLEDEEIPHEMWLKLETEEGGRE